MEYADSTLHAAWLYRSLQPHRAVSPRHRTVGIGPGQIDPNSPLGKLLQSVEGGQEGLLTAHDYFSILFFADYVVAIQATYVNDNTGEVDSVDVADGSLTGADVSTSCGDVTFAELMQR